MRNIAKFETSFSRIGDHRKGVKNPNAIEACKHFNTEKR